MRKLIALITIGLLILIALGRIGNAVKAELEVSAARVSDYTAASVR